MLDTMLIEHSTTFLLTKNETDIFIELVIQDDNSPYTPFILVLFKEVGNDIAKFLRVISSAAKTPGFTPKGLVRKVIMTIKESIIIHELRQNKYASITELTNQYRYTQVGITRNFIYQTISKYSLR